MLCDMKLNTKILRNINIAMSSDFFFKRIYMLRKQYYGNTYAVIKILVGKFSTMC